MPTLEVMEATMSGIVSAKFPSVTALALALVASVILIVLVRVAFTRLVNIFNVPKGSADVDANEKGTHTSPSLHSTEPNNTRSSKYGAMSTWSWSWSWRWEGLPVSLPVSLAVTEKDWPGASAGTGVAAAMQQQQQSQQRQPPKMTWQKHRRSPGFVSPLPALHNTPVPASMAKMIMSRHVRIFVAAACLNASLTSENMHLDVPPARSKPPATTPCAHTGSPCFTTTVPSITFVGMTHRRAPSPNCILLFSSISLIPPHIINASPPPTFTTARFTQTHTRYSLRITLRSRSLNYGYRISGFKHRSVG
ncbi:hypothetical protein PILCRDRAFT_457763 [Piloderma croceum F 1598]|uniref:Uncharacterized protein n=1 Tax=Piloderma croceum (strain F 1598) TaxID=765440 RepID=A0A0C3FEH3_PILCF|nr:hypothetical protein PILCRDRAFT_457763 [Piloderma croceum F 1598]